MCFLFHTGFESAIMMYTRQFIGTNNAVISGHIYRGARHPSLRGTYLAADHVGILWAMPETPYDSGKFQLKQLRPVCAIDSSKCTTTLGNIFTVAVDSIGDIYFVASRGIHRLVEMDRCKVQSTLATTTPLSPSPLLSTATPTLSTFATTTPTSSLDTSAPFAELSRAPSSPQASSGSIVMCGALYYIISLCILVREILLLI